MPRLDNPVNRDKAMMNHSRKIWISQKLLRKRIIFRPDTRQANKSEKWKNNSIGKGRGILKYEPLAILDIVPSLQRMIDRF